MKIFSAPLQGYTDCAWRNAHAQVFAGTIDRYYAPFIRLEKGVFRNKDLRDIAPQANTDYRLVPQAIACPAEQLVLIVEKIASMGYGEIDINMGCPFPPVVKRHWGAGMLPYPEEVASMLDTLKHFPGIKFSVKMRLGVENADEWRELMPMLADANLAHVTMHPRTARQQYGGTTDMGQFARFCNAATFPVVYNGDLCSTKDIENISAHFPCLKAVMIGRGLLRNPALSCDVHTTDPWQKAIALHDLLLNHYSKHLSGDSHLLMKMKSLWEFFLADTGDKKCRKKILKSTSIEKYRLAVNDFWQSLSE